MANEKETGGAAFPHHYESTAGHPYYRESQGMTLRDYFAAKALAGLLANTNESDNTVRYAAENPGLTSDKVLARCAYTIADAMIAERAKSSAPGSQR